MFSGRALVRIEINNDCGLSPITAPRLRIKAIADRTIKTLNALKVEGICTIRVQPYREDAAINATMMVVRSWTLGFAPPGMTHAELQTRLRQQLTVSVTKVPNVRVKPVAADGLDMEVGSFLKLPTRTVTLQRSAKGARRWSPAAAMSDVEAWSAIEATAEISLPYLLIGVGPRGRAWAGDLKSKVLAAQRARVEQGLVLPADQDAWASFAGARADIRKCMLSVRSDVAMKLPPAAKKTKVKARPAKSGRKPARITSGRKLMPPTAEKG